MPPRSSSSVRVFYPRRDREQVVRALADGVARLAAIVPLRRVVLFGSYATGRYTVASDIDLLVVYGGPSRADAYATIRRILGVRGVELHLYTEAEAKAAAPTLDRMIGRGIDLLTPRP